MTYEHNSIKDKVWRLLRAIMEQLPWIGVLYTGIWYARLHIKAYIYGYFDIASLAKTVQGLEIRAGILKDGLSLVSPMKLGDYLGVSSNLAFTQAKMVTAQKTADLLIGTTHGLLTIALWVAAFYAALRILKSYRTQNQNNEIANLVVQKLLPFIQKQK